MMVNHKEPVIFCILVTLSHYIIAASETNCSQLPSNAFWEGNSSFSLTCTWLCLPGFDEVKGGCNPCLTCGPSSYSSCWYPTMDVEVDNSIPTIQQTCIRACANVSLVSTGVWSRKSSTKSCQCANKMFESTRDSKKCEELISIDETGRCEGHVNTTTLFGYVVMDHTVLDKNAAAFATPYRGNLQDCVDTCNAEKTCRCFSVFSDVNLRRTCMYSTTCLSKRVVSRFWEPQPSESAQPSLLYVKYSSACLYCNDGKTTKDGLDYCKCPEGSYLSPKIERNFSCLQPNSIDLQTEYFDTELGEKSLVSMCLSSARSNNRDAFCFSPSARRCYLRHDAGSVCLADPSASPQAPRQVYRRFSLHLSQRSWMEAESFCVGQGGHLASIRHVSEVSRINELARDVKDVWIGLRVEAQGAQTETNRVSWSDGSSLSTLSDLSGLEPGCTSLRPYSGSYFSSDCNHTSLPFVCSYTSSDVLQLQEDLTCYSTTSFCRRCPDIDKYFGPNVVHGYGDAEMKTCSLRCKDGFSHSYSLFYCNGRRSALCNKLNSCRKSMERGEAVCEQNLMRCGVREESLLLRIVFALPFMVGLLLFISMRLFPSVWMIPDGSGRMRCNSCGMSLCISCYKERIVERTQRHVRHDGTLESICVKDVVMLKCSNAGQRAACSTCGERNNLPWSLVCGRYFKRVHDGGNFKVKPFVPWSEFSGRSVIFGLRRVLLSDNTAKHMQYPLIILIVLVMLFIMSLGYYHSLPYWNKTDAILVLIIRLNLIGLPFIAVICFFMIMAEMEKFQCCVCSGDKSCQVCWTASEWRKHSESRIDLSVLSPTTAGTRPGRFRYVRNGIRCNNVFLFQGMTETIVLQVESSEGDVYPAPIFLLGRSSQSLPYVSLDAKTGDLIFQASCKLCKKEESFVTVLIAAVNPLGIAMTSVRVFIDPLPRSPSNLTYENIDGYILMNEAQLFKQCDISGNVQCSWCMEQSTEFMICETCIRKGRCSPMLCMQCYYEFECRRMSRHPHGHKFVNRAPAQLGSYVRHSTRPPHKKGTSGRRKLVERTLKIKDASTDIIEYSSRLSDVSGGKLPNGHMRFLLYLLTPIIPSAIVVCDYIGLYPVSEYYLFGPFNIALVAGLAFVVWRWFESFQSSMYGSISVKCLGYRYTAVKVAEDGVLTSDLSVDIIDEQPHPTFQVLGTETVKTKTHVQAMARLDACGYPLPRFSAETALPPGLFIDEESGCLYGFPLQDGEFEIRVRAHNEFGSCSCFLRMRISPSSLGSGSRRIMPSRSPSLPALMLREDVHHSARIQISQQTPGEGRKSNVRDVFRYMRLDLLESQVSVCNSATHLRTFVGQVQDGIATANLTGSFLVLSQLPGDLQLDASSGTIRGSLSPRAILTSLPAVCDAIFLHANGQQHIRTRLFLTVSELLGELALPFSSIKYAHIRGASYGKNMRLPDIPDILAVEPETFSIRFEDEVCIAPCLVACQAVMSSLRHELLISDQLVLTVAHCPASKCRPTLGRMRITSSGSEVQELDLEVSWGAAEEGWMRTTDISDLYLYATSMLPGWRVKPLSAMVDGKLELHKNPLPPGLSLSSQGVIYGIAELPHPTVMYEVVHVGDPADESKLICINVSSSTSTRRRAFVRTVCFVNSFLQSLACRLYVRRKLELLWIKSSAGSFQDLDLDEVLRYCSPPVKRLGGHLNQSRQEPTNVTIPGFDVLGLIGRGGQGIVYLAQAEGSQSKFAVKVCNRPDEREYQNLKTLQQLQHPNIVKMFDCLVEPFAIVMEFVEGQSLKEIMQTSEDGECRQLGEEMVQTIGGQMLEGLSLLHRMGIIHRDLKPSNIMCSFPHADVCRVVLIDFGSSKHQDYNETLTRTGQFVGTWQYFSPEQCRGDPQLDARVDVWSAGVVLYEMAAGRNPFYSHDVLELFTAVRRQPFQQIPGCGAAMNIFLKTALKKDPRDRFCDANEMQQVFADVFDDPHQAIWKLSCRTSTFDEAREVASARPLHEQLVSNKWGVLAFFVKRNINVSILTTKIENKLNEESNTDRKDMLTTLLRDELENIDPFEEANIMQDTTMNAMFDIRIYPQPTFENFVRYMGICSIRNIKIIHLSGHGDQTNGFWWLKEGTKTEFDYKKPLEVVDVIAVQAGGSRSKSSVECVVLNACQSESMGKQLVDRGVKHVICWKGKVHDETATSFSRFFYESLDDLQPGNKDMDYARIFDRACLRCLHKPMTSGPESRGNYSKTIDRIMLLTAGGTIVERKL